MAKKPDHGKFNRKLVYLETRDIQAIWNYAREKSLGRKGFSAALRLIIREWQYLRQGGVRSRPPGGPPGKNGPSGNKGACQ